MMKMMENIERIQNVLDKSELLAQLAEEAAELAKSALKLRRVIDGTNPTPITMSAAESSLLEEAADVMLVLRCLEIYAEDYGLRSIMIEKSKRWAYRLYDKDQWISVDEKLPPVDELVETKNDRHQIIGECRLMEDGTWFSYVCRGIGAKLDPEFYPTHWRKPQTLDRR